MRCCRVSGSFKAATLLLLIGLIVHVIGFVTPLWSTRTPDFEGLWLLCNAGSCSPFPSNSSPTWFVNNQVLQSIGIVIALAAVIVALTFFCSSGIRRCFNACGIVIILLVFISAILLTAGLTLYGVQSKVTDPDVFLLASYWLTLAAVIIYFLSGVIFSFTIDRDWRNDEENVEAMMWNSDNLEIRK